jgi:MFS family permease
VPAAPVIIVCAVTALWGLSFGIGTQATSHWLDLHEASDTLIGLVHAAYYLGVAAASLTVPRITRRLGLATCSFGMLASALSLALFPLASGPVGWLILRALCGAACALSLIPLETYLSHSAAPERRTEAFSYYAVALTLAGAVGIALGLEGFNPEGLLIGILGQPRNAFIAGALFPLLGSMIAQHALGRFRWDDDGASDRPSVSWRRNFLSFGTAWGQGFLEGGMLAFLSLFLVSREMSTSAAGILMGVAMIGVIAFQIPVGWIADRCGRRPPLFTCYAVTIAALAIIPWCQSLAALGLWLFLFGACSGAMYPLGLSLLSEKTSAGSLARAYSWYLAMECVGSQFGAAIMGKARDLWGGEAMFAVAALGLLGVLVVWAALQCTDRAAEEESSHDKMRRAA